MKDKDKSCKKGKESTIGKMIYGFLLFMPLIAIGTSILVNTFNMSAKEESEIIYKYKTNEVNSLNDLVKENAYHFSINNNSIDTYLDVSDSNYINLQFFNIEKIDFSNYGLILDEYVNQINNANIPLSIYLTSEAEASTIAFPSNDASDYMAIFIIDGSLADDNFTIIGDCILYSYENLADSSILSKCENIPIESVETHNVDTQDIFYKSIDKVEDSNLFNWVENNAIYTGIQDTCEILSITNTFIPLLLTYWLIISVLYFLYDIILMILHMLHRKIHELQDSI